jgi:endogenous inhibitor of DNA gyrase (YacG/DUF329 family)
MRNRCPICHKQVKVSSQEQAEEAKFFPFCSQRCKLVDLGGWLDGKYKIISESQPQQAGSLSDVSSGSASGK